MSIATARALAETLDGKAPGHLITAQDWNDLVSVLLEYGAGLDGLPERMTAAEAALAALTARIVSLETLPARVQQLEAETAPLRANYLLSVQTTAESVLVGQVAEIVFRATALDGRPLTGPRPWLDVVATWGRLRAAPGFTVRDNAEENAISVQFNAAGEVRVQLRAQFTKGFSTTQEAGFSNALQANVGSTGKSVQRILSEASSPQDAQAQQAFQHLHGSYEANQSFKFYADGYLGQYHGGQYTTITPVRQRGSWEEYRATVMAFAKPDASPTTPDPTRGVATLQVAFREWIPSWSDHYILDVERDVAIWNGRLVGQLDRPDLLPVMVGELDRLAAGGAGVLGHVRNMKALERAALQVDAGGQPLRQQNKALLAGALKLQFATGGGGTLAASGYAQQAQTTQTIGLQAQAAQAQAADAATAKNTVIALEGRIRAAEQTGRELSAGLRNIGDGVNKINVAEVSDLGGRLNRINLDIANLANRIG